LQSQGCQAVSATNGGEGLAFWTARPDIRMVITLLDDKECLLLGAGNDNFVGKPVRRAALDLRLQSHFGRFRSAR
jgi:DNA-binding response OmpR family regulator